MLKGIEELKSKLNEVMSNPDILQIAKTIDGLEIAISNANLLSNTLISFYQNEESAYFPRTITDKIEVFIRDANAQLNTLTAKKPPDKQLQENLDKLYEICLQSGITSFGFKSKELNHILDNAKRNIQCIEKKASEINDELEKQTQEFKRNVDEKNTVLDSNVNSSNELKGKVTQIEQSAKEKNESIENLLADASKLLEEIKKAQQEANATKNAIDSENINTQNITSQIQSKLNEANQLTSQITAKNNTANDTLSAIQERKKAADEFYTTVETYKKEMLDTKKKAMADYSELKEICDTTIAENTKQSEEIIQQNTAYQEQIKELLAKAVSGGLFKVFNQRQVFLSKGTRFWKWAVVVSSILVAAGILVVAYICEAKPDIIFFVRLAIMIPLAFLMVFTATQYKKERQAEEEYAFKSAISLSLEPYRDLLVRMRKEDQSEADFVKKLMEEVFDNPVMRMFNIEEEEEKIAKMIINLLKKLPKEKISSVIDTVTKMIAEQK